MSKFLKIAFVGSHGVGKTTLVEELKQVLKLTSDQVVEETAARVFELGKTDPALQINQGSTLEAQLKIIGMQIEEENSKAAKLSEGSENQYLVEHDPLKYSKLLLCDRTAFDALAYTYARAYRDGKYDWARSLCTHLYNWILTTLRHKYDLVFYLPVSFPIQKTDVRPDDLDFQEEMDVIIQEMFLRCLLGGKALSEGTMTKQLLVLSGPVEKRIARAIKAIDATMSERPQLVRTGHKLEALRGLHALQLAESRSWKEQLQGYDEPGAKINQLKGWESAAEAVANSKTKSISEQMNEAIKQLGSRPEDK
jgi:energy-coupling factor transporter ATP-binding protein EcfA2